MSVIVPKGEFRMEFNKKALRNIFLLVCGGIILYWILHETERLNAVIKLFSGILSPFAVGAGIAFIINVPMRRIEAMLNDIPKAGLRRCVAILLTLLAFVFVVAIVFWLLIPQVIQTAETFASKLPAFFIRIETYIRDFLSANPELMEVVYENTNLESIDIAGVVQKVVDMVGTSVSAILSGAFSAIGGVTSGIVNGVISFVFALYCLARKEILARQGRRILYAFLPERVCDEIIRIFRLTNSRFSNFLSGQFIEVCILGCMFAVAMMIFGMPYIPLVSVLVAVTAFIPLVGAFVGCILGALFILVDNPLQAVWFVLMFLVIQQIEGNMIYPRVVGTSIGLPGMWVLVAVAIGGELMGVFGMFIMIPLASVIYTLLGELTNSRLSNRNIDPAKLQDHPPEITSKFRQRKKQKLLKKAAQEKNKK